MLTSAHFFRNRFRHELLKRGGHTFLRKTTNNHLQKNYLYSQTPTRINKEAAEGGKTTRAYL